MRRLGYIARTGPVDAKRKERKKEEEASKKNQTWL